VSIRRLLLSPQGYWGTTLQWLVVLLLAMPLFDAWFLLSTPREHWLSGLLGGLFSAFFTSLAMGHFFKSVTRVVRITEPRSFEPAVRAAASALGYQPTSPSAGMIACRPSHWAGLAAAWLSIELRGVEAVVVGANLAVRRFLLELEFGASWPSA
jgi:hypothetical protein